MPCKLTNNVLYFMGELSAKSVPQLMQESKALLGKDKPAMIDLTGVSGIDNAGVAYLDAIQIKYASQGVLLIKGASDEIQEIITTFSSLKLPVPEPIVNIGFFENIGNSVIVAYESMYQAMLLASEIYYWSFVGIFNHKGQRKGSLVQQATLLGSQALPIVALLSFIIGFILSLQSAVQLRNFGANVFIADLLAVTMVREMGPMMTAIIIAGRSGSAIASEIATMQVTEEIDALKMMALSPIRYVVVPKFHAITFVMPILVAFSILVGMIGGGIIALGFLDLSLHTFVSRSIEIITLKDLVISLGKSTVFAWVIVIIGSYFGFQVKGGAEGVGKATTASVVASIFAVIMLDAMFSLLYL
ncbi:MAG: MlaE family lipid ABC transporter permease subunit [Candidatus Cloacimonetes bacterium]|nr:MlaE family lipid ABC transporter permease subunit [Candidatus Cloacimonadota bacterium]MDD3235693.1 MlaE family lipid ABC transporter permease subunit [Candidatus Cloacimonadota bacterium]